MAERIDLVYPLYLDVPMMTSFVAALEDGIAYGSDVTQRQDQQRKLGAGSEARVGVPGMGIFSTLLNIDLRGKITGEQVSGNDEEIKLVRRHTEASLFMRLRHTLVNDNRILQINDIDDIQQLKDAEQDYLVEIRGQISRSPLNESLEAVFRAMAMLGVEPPTNQTLRTQTGGGKKNRGQGQQNASSNNPFALDREAMMGLEIMQRIREDLAQSKILDAVMRPATVDELTVVIALALEFLPEGAFDNLLSGDFSVLGKVTRLVEGADEISLYQRTAFRNLEFGSLDAAFAEMRKGGIFKLSDSPSSIKAPAIQIMPMAIYA